MMRAERHPVRSTDPLGRAIVRVPVHVPRRLRDQLGSPVQWVAVDAEDFDRSIAAGLGSQWYLNASGQGTPYVRATLMRSGGRLVSVAGFLMGDHRRRQVRFLDGDRLNLRRSNLELKERRGRVRPDPFAEVLDFSERPE